MSSSNIQAGQMIKINPELLGEGKPDDLKGDLGYPNLFKHLIFEVVRLEVDAGRGEIAICRVTNADVLVEALGAKEVKCEGECVLLVKDLVAANTMTTLEYVIESGKSKEEMLKELFINRDRLEAQGLKKGSKERKENYKQIQIVRGEIAGPMPETKVWVNLPKQKARFLVDSKILPTAEEESINKFKQFLSNKLRELRRGRKTANVEIKTPFGIPTKSSGGVYLQEGSLLHAYEEMMKTTLETDKKPTDPKATYIGMEFEFVYKGNYDALKKLLINHKLHRYICLKEDGSLRACHNNDNYKTKELTMICTTKELESVLQRLDAVFIDPSIDGYVNRTCGLHVHLDVRNRKAETVYRNLVRVQKILRGSQPVGRITNRHCKVNPTDDLKVAQEQYRGDRYFVVNADAFARHQTIEVRIHEGTVNCEDAYNWALFLDAIASHKAEIPKNEASFAEELASRYNVSIPISAVDYVDTRVKRFKSLTAV